MWDKNTDTEEETNIDRNYLTSRLNEGTFV
jgi:hypothetical protein